RQFPDPGNTARVVEVAHEDVGGQAGQQDEGRGQDHERRQAGQDAVYPGRARCQQLLEGGHGDFRASTRRATISPTVSFLSQCTATDAVDSRNGAGSTSLAFREASALTFTRRSRSACCESRRWESPGSAAASAIAYSTG